MDSDGFEWILIYFDKYIHGFQWFLFMNVDGFSCILPVYMQAKWENHKQRYDVVLLWAYKGLCNKLNMT